MSIPENPPDVNYQPWYHATLVFSKQGSAEIKVSDVAAVFRSQLDPESHAFKKEAITDEANGFRMQFKVNSVRCWNLTGQVIALTCFDTVTTGADAAKSIDQLCGIVDTGSPSHTPGAGYSYSAATRQNVVRTDKTMSALPIAHALGTGSDRIMMYIDIMWRLDGPTKIPHLASLLSDIAVNTASTTELTSEVRDLIKVMKENQPSKIMTTIKNVGEVAGIAVAVAGAAVEDDDICSFDSVSS